MQSLSTALRTAVNAGNPQRVLLKFGNDEFSNEDIVMSNGVELSEEFNSEHDITIGLTPSSILTFTMLNDTGQLANFGFGWFTAYLGASVVAADWQQDHPATEISRTFTEGGVSVTYAFAPLGTFYAERPDVVAKTTIDVTAYDQMILFDRDMPSKTALSLTYPTTIGTIFTKMCTYLNVSYQSSSFTNSALAVASEPADMGMATMRDVLGWIAEAACCNARFNRDSKLEMAWFNTVNASFDEGDYKGFTPSWYETTAINGVYFRDTNESRETSKGQTKTNNYLIQDNPFLLERGS